MARRLSLRSCVSAACPARCARRWPLAVAGRSPAIPGNKIDTGQCPAEIPACSVTKTMTRQSRQFVVNGFCSRQTGKNGTGCPGQAACSCYNKFAAKMFPLSSLPSLTGQWNGPSLARFVYKDRFRDLSAGRRTGGFVADFIGRSIDNGAAACRMFDWARSAVRGWSRGFQKC